MTKALTFLITALVLTLCGVEFQSYVRQQASEHARLAHQEYLREAKLAQASGVSLDRNSLNPAIPAATEDADPIYEQISEELAAHPWNEAPLDDIGRTGRPATSLEIVTAKQILRQHARLLALIHTAAERRKCALTINRNTPDPFMMSIRYFDAISRTERVLNAESVIMAREGHTQEAIRNQALGFRIADHFYSGKGMIFALFGNTANAIALNGTKRILYRYGDKDPMVAPAVLQAIRNNAHSPDIPSILGTEATLDHAHIDYLRTLPPKEIWRIQHPQTQAASNIRWKFPEARTSQEWRDAYLDTSAEEILQQQLLDIRASAYPYPQATMMLQADATEWAKLGAKRTQVALALGEDFPKFIRVQWKNTAAIRVMEVSAQILIWKSRHGAFPIAVRDIGNAPLDPFSGKPFCYRREGAGFVLYSIGEDGTFDGGDPTLQKRSISAMFRYPANLKVNAHE